MDYYIDSAYPIERTGYGPGQIRIANYGDGTTKRKTIEQRRRLHQQAIAA
jgi:hypothetical protein